MVHHSLSEDQLRGHSSLSVQQYIDMMRPHTSGHSMWEIRELQNSDDYDYDELSRIFQLAAWAAQREARAEQAGLPKPRPTLRTDTSLRAAMLAIAHELDGVIKEETDKKRERRRDNERDAEAKKGALRDYHHALSGAAGGGASAAGAGARGRSERDEYHTYSRAGVGSMTTRQTRRYDMMQ